MKTVRYISNRYGLWCSTCKIDVDEGHRCVAKAAQRKQLRQCPVCYQTFETHSARRKHRCPKPPKPKV